MINPINISTNQIYYTNKQVKETKPANVSAPNFELSDYKTGQAILARNNISFRNLAAPIEVTDKYNKKVEGKDHLDLPNVHIYEYPDTNLKVFINLINTAEAPQYTLSTHIETNENYNTIKQALINKILFSKFKQKNLEKFYLNTPPYTSQSQLVSTGMDYPLKINNIPEFNKILTSNNFSNKELDVAKKDLINYLNSDNYRQDNYLALELYDENTSSKKDIIKDIDKITIDDLKDYHTKILQNSNIQATLTIDKSYFDTNKNDILKMLNDNIAGSFKQEPEKTKIQGKLLNNKLKIVNKNDNTIKTDYLVNPDELKDYIILDILSKIFLEYSEDEQRRLNSYIDKQTEEYKTSDLEVRKSYRKILREHELNSNFITLSGEKNLNFVREPLEVFKISDKSKLSGYYYSIYFPNNSNIEELVKEQKLFFNKLEKTDISEALEKIKDNYKSYIKTVLTDDNYITSMKNLYMAQFNTDIFNTYEIVDSITQEDIKAVINKYFINQQPIVEIGNKN